MRLRGLAASIATLLVAPAMADAVAPGVIAQEGEILILEGDDEIVGEVATGSALTPAAIANLLDRIYQHLPDDFDMVVVSTTFVDALSPGAYYMADAPTPSSRSLGFIHMNQVGSFGDVFAPVLAQEFSHAWLAFTSFVDPGTGLVSDELLGRDLAHWSARVDAEGSFQDGVDWVDNGDGTFTVAGYMERFSPLDLWTMGFAGDDEVPDFVVLQTDEVPRDQPPPLGLTVASSSIVVRLADIIAADGPQPPWQTRQHDFRIVFVLITDRGESAEAARPLAAVLDAQRAGWSAAMPGWLWDRGTMCTELSLPCDVAHLAFASAGAREGAGGDGDGVIEPGEPAVIDVVWRNSGAVSASGGSAALELPVGWTRPEPLPIDDVAPGGEAISELVLDVPAAAVCGEEVSVTAVAQLGALTWRGTVALAPGLDARPVPSGAAWQADAAGDDTATAGGWARGVSELVLYDGHVLQPDGDDAWWTGPARGSDWKAADLDGGTTSLISPSLDLAGLAEPSVRYRVWYVALDFGATPPPPTDGDDLVVEASDDDGATWHEIDRVSGAPLAWSRREASLATVDTGRPIRLRFTAGDLGAIQNMVEVGLDQIEVVGSSDDCAPADAGGCGCRAEDRSSSLVLVLVLVVVLVVSRRERRRT